MPTLIERPARVPAGGSPPKLIDEFVGRVNTPGMPFSERLSVARMRSPAGWAEPGQQPDFLEVTLVLRGLLRVEWRSGGCSGTLKVRAGQAVVTGPGEWVRYDTPEETDYVSVCLPAFSPEAARRDRG